MTESASVVFTLLTFIVCMCLNSFRVVISKSMLYVIECLVSCNGW